VVIGNCELGGDVVRALLAWHTRSSAMLSSKGEKAAE